MKKIVATLGIAACLSAAATANQVPTPSRNDARMRTVAYNPSEVVRLATAQGSALIISFAADEKISAVAVADSANLSASPRDNFLFLKSKAPLAPQPVIVLTNGSHGSRRYVFEFEALSPARLAAERRNVYYSVEFRYPDQEARARAAAQARAAARARAAAAAAAARRNLAARSRVTPQAPLPLNYQYSVRGDRKLMPSTIYDNGYATYFRFPSTARMPAIFRINPDGREGAVNYAAKNGYAVVGAVASGWVLRDGRTKLKIFNRAYGRVAAGSSPAAAARRAS